MAFQDGWSSAERFVHRESSEEEEEKNRAKIQERRRQEKVIMMEQGKTRKISWFQMADSGLDDKVEDILAELTP